MIPFIPPKLAPWIEFIPDGVKLKDGAPEELKPIFEEFRVKLKQAQEGMITMNGKPISQQK